MLIVTDTRKASVKGRFLKPWTKRSEVVKPTSKKPPTISQNHAISGGLLEVQRRAQEVRAGDRVDDVDDFATSDRRRLLPIREAAANLLHRTAGPDVMLADAEHDRLDAGEGVAEHQALHLAIGAAAPKVSGKERPADLHFARQSEFEAVA